MDLPRIFLPETLEFPPLILSGTVQAVFNSGHIGLGSFSETLVSHGFRHWYSRWGHACKESGTLLSGKWRLFRSV